MAKKPKTEEEMTAEAIERLVRNQDHLSKQMEYLIRLVQGDQMLNTIRPTGLINDVKSIDERLKFTEREVMGVVHWFNDRSKKRYLVTVNLIEWGKFIAWVVGVGGAIVGFFAWIGKHLQR